MLFKNGRQDAWVGRECLKVLTQPGHAYVRSSGHERLRQGSVMVVLSPAWWNGTLWEEMHRTRERDPSQQDISVRACADESSLGEESGDEVQPMGQGQRQARGKWVSGAQTEGRRGQHALQAA